MHGRPPIPIVRVRAVFPRAAFAGPAALRIGWIEADGAEPEARL